MNDTIPIEKVTAAQELFQSGHTYRQISEQLNISMSLVASVLTTVGGGRDLLLNRRLLMNQMAQSGEFVEDIATAVGLNIHSVKEHLRRARIKYNIKPKE